VFWGVKAWTNPHCGLASTAARNAEVRTASPQLQLRRAQQQEGLPVAWQVHVTCRTTLAWSLTRSQYAKASQCHMSSMDKSLFNGQLL